MTKRFSFELPFRSIQVWNILVADRKYEQRGDSAVPTHLCNYSSSNIRFSVFSTSRVPISLSDVDGDMLQPDIYPAPSDPTSEI